MNMNMNGGLYKCETVIEFYNSIKEVIKEIFSTSTFAYKSSDWSVPALYLRFSHT